VTPAQDAGQRALTLSKGPRTKVLTLERKDVEHEYRYWRPVLRLEPVAGSIEGTAARSVHDHELAIQDHMLSSESPDGGGSLAPVPLHEAASSDTDLDRRPVLPQQYPAAI